MEPQLFIDPQIVSSPRTVLEMEEKVRRQERMIVKLSTTIKQQPPCLIGKKPWEMTRSTWESIIAPVSEAYKASILIGESVARVFHDRYGYTHNGYAFHFTSLSNSRHEAQVAYASLRGDSIPDEVAREYPKEHWMKTFDLQDFKHLPRYVFSEEERLAAISYWQQHKDHVEMMIKDKYFNYQSESELKHHVVCFDRILSELTQEKVS